MEQIQKDKIKVLSPRSVNSHIQMIKTVYNFAIDRGVFKSINPIAKIKILKTDNIREKYLSLKEIQKLEDAVIDDEQLSLFVKLALCTGGRISTVVNIKKKDINFTTQTINLTDFKNCTSYKGFIPNELTNILEDRIEYLDFDAEVLNFTHSKDLIGFITTNLTFAPKTKQFSSHIL